MITAKTLILLPYGGKNQLCMLISPVKETPPLLCSRQRDIPTCTRGDGCVCGVCLPLIPSCFQSKVPVCGEKSCLSKLVISFAGWCGMSPQLLMCFFIIIIYYFCLGPVHFTQAWLFSLHHTLEQTFQMFIMCNRITFLLPNLLIGYRFDWQLRACPHLESDALSECLSMQHLHGPAPSQHPHCPATSQHSLNGKEGRSPALGQEIFTGTAYFIFFMHFLLTVIWQWCEVGEV